MSETLEANVIPHVETKGGVVAYLNVEGAAKAAAFYEKAFGATIATQHPLDDQGRTMHIHLYVNGSSLMLGDFYPEHGFNPVKPRVPMTTRSTPSCFAVSTIVDAVGPCARCASHSTPVLRTFSATFSSWRAAASRTPVSSTCGTSTP